MLPSTIDERSRELIREFGRAQSRRRAKQDLHAVRDSMTAQAAAVQAYYMISVVAQKYNIHPQTLRLYEREGLLKPSRTDGNTRLYSEQDLEQLETILSLTRDLGVNLAGVEIILNMRRKIEAMQLEVNEFMEYVKRELSRGIGDWEQRLEHGAGQVVTDRSRARAGRPTIKEADEDMTAEKVRSARTLTGQIAASSPLLRTQAVRSFDVVHGDRSEDRIRLLNLISFEIRRTFCRRCIVVVRYTGFLHHALLPLRRHRMESGRIRWRTPGRPLRLLARRPDDAPARGRAHPAALPALRSRNVRHLSQREAARRRPSGATVRGRVSGSSQKGLCLIGPPGIGKTHLAVAVLRQRHPHEGRARAVLRHARSAARDPQHLQSARPYRGDGRAPSGDGSRPPRPRRHRFREDLRVGRRDDEPDRQHALQRAAAHDLHVELRGHAGSRNRDPDFRSRSASGSASTRACTRCASSSSSTAPTTGTRRRMPAATIS